MCNGARAKASAGACADSAGVEHLGSMVGMVPADPGVGGTPAAARLDPESAEGLRVLGEVGPQREAALARLHERLGRIARGEARRAVDTELAARQREVFVAIVLNEVPLDTLVLSLASSRNAIYKMLFDARRKLRAALAANGYLRDESSRRS